MATVLEALKTLAGLNDDHAQELNGVGFNKIDTDFGMSLASRDSLSPKQEVYGYKMIRKYRKQLQNYGIDFDSIPNPNAAETNKWENPVKIKKGYTEVVYIKCIIKKILPEYRERMILEGEGDKMLLHIENGEYQIYNYAGYLVQTLLNPDHAKEMLQTERDAEGKLLKLVRQERI